jgi:hypothetical protein
MMLRRIPTFLAVLLAALITLAAPAAATPSPSGKGLLRSLAAGQNQQLFRYYYGRPQVASPQDCDAARSRNHVEFLPSLSFGAGSADFTCHLSARKVVVDLGGLIATEDARGDTYTLSDGEELTYTEANLERICADAVRYLSAPAPATLDGSPVTGSLVVTRVFEVPVNPAANNPPDAPYYQDSVDLGHPGRLAACYVGYKALLYLSPGEHTLSVDLSDYVGPGSTFTYTLYAPGHGHGPRS